MAQYEVTHDVGDEDAWRAIEAEDKDEAVRQWVETDPYVDEFSDHFDAWVRAVDNPSRVTKHKVRLERTMVVYVDGRRGRS